MKYRVVVYYYARNGQKKTVYEAHKCAASTDRTAVHGGTARQHDCHQFWSDFSSISSKPNPE